MKRIVSILIAFAVLTCTIRGSYGGCAVDEAKDCAQSACHSSASSSLSCSTLQGEDNPCKPDANSCSIPCCQCIYIIPEFQFEIPLLLLVFETEQPNALQNVFEHLFFTSIWRPPADLA